MNAFINEFHYDNEGADVDEFVEIAGIAGLDLTGWTVVLYNGSNGLAYDTITLSGVFTNESGGYGFLDFTPPGGSIQNGTPDGMALVDDMGGVVEFLSYEGSFTAGDGPAAGLVSTDIGFAEGAGTVIGFSLQRLGIGSEVADFPFTAPGPESRGTVNPGQIFLPPASFDLRITEIWPGNDQNPDLTEDWFEVTNFGDRTWVAATDGDLYFDDESASVADAALLSGVASISPGETVVFVDDADTASFVSVWGGVIDLDGVKIGTYAGAGLGGGGDAVTLFIEGDETVGDGMLENAVTLDFEAYPDTVGNPGESFDVEGGDFSGNLADQSGVATTAPNAAGEPAVGSPGDGAPIEPSNAAFTLELLHLADQEPLNAGGSFSDITNASAILNALKAQDLGNDGLADNTLVLSSGDAFIPGLFFDASAAVFGSAGIADIQIQNELGVQAIAFGNHEFDFGTGVLAGLIDGSAPGDFTALAGSTLEGLDFTGTAFPYLSGNLDFLADPNLAPLAVSGGQAPAANVVTSSTVIGMTADGTPMLTGDVPERIGVVGATTPTLASISSPGMVGISPSLFGTSPSDAELDALAAAIQVEVDALLAANPDMNKVILLAHMQQIDIEFELASRLSGVDIIVGGGSNTRLFDENDRARDGDSDQGVYPQFIPDADGNITAVVNTDGSYKYVGRLAIDFDADGKIIPESYDAEVSGAYATDAQGVAELGAEGLVDPEIQAIVDAVEAQILATESNVFGVSDVFLNGNRSGIGTPGDPDGVRTQETNLGNLTADANLVAARAVEADVVVSLKNGGGIRASIGQTVVPPGGTEAERLPNAELTDADGNLVKPAGGISQNDIQTTLAFNNGLTLLTVTGAELVALLEHGVGAAPGVSGRFPQVSGVKFSYDPDLPEGSRILNAGIFDQDDNLIAELVRDGEIAGDGGQLFRIVTLDFLAAPRFDEDGNFIGGGDGYPFPNTNTDPAVGEVGPDAARVNPTPLEREGVTTGFATFADDGTEQDALAEYLSVNFGDASTAFDQSDTGPDQDARIQNLDFRADNVFGEAAGLSIVISEIMYNPESAEDDWEWIEITNTGTQTVDLSGFVLDDANSAFHTGATIASGTIAAGGSAVLYNADDVTEAEFTAAWGDGLNLIAVTDWAANGFNNGGDLVAIWASFEAYSADIASGSIVTDNAVDFVEYDDDGTIWPADDNDSSIYLTDLSADNNIGTNWALSGVGEVTPTGTGRGSVADAASGNEGDVGSPGGDPVEPPFVAPDPELLVEVVGSIRLAGAEIVDFDAETRQAFVTSSGGLQVVDLADVTNPVLTATLSAEELGFDASDVTSVSVKNGLIAVARPDVTGTLDDAPADPFTGAGQVLFYSAGTLKFMGVVQVGPLPDMLTFSDDGAFLLVANEGQSSHSENVPDASRNPEGSVSIIQVDYDNPTVSPVTTLDFTDASITFQSLAAKGVRVNPNAPSAAADIEPEYITIQGRTAFISLQENNAIAVIEDIANPTPFTIDSILPAGVVDHGRGTPSLQTFDLADLPLLGVDANGLEIAFGGLSGLYFKEETAETVTFLAVPDRGPNGGEVVDGARTFNLPDYQARVVELVLDKATGAVSIANEVLLTRADGETPITGLPNIEGFDEIPVDAAGNPLPYDEFGADLEGVVLDTDGTFWMVDEYRPAIYHFDPAGALIDRFVAEGTSLLGDVAQPEGTFGTETLPEDYADRRANRGFEAVAADLEARKLYAFIQTPIENPDRATSNESQVIRILELDMDTGTPTGEYVYLLEDAGIRPGGRVDKIGDAVFDPETGKMLVVERDSTLGLETGIKPIYEIDFNEATNVLGKTFSNGLTLEQQTPETLAAEGVFPVFKTEIVNPPSLGYTASDKIEGLALLPDGSLAILNDNDFGIEEATGLLPQLGIVSFAGGRLDASNTDDAINLDNYDIFGMRMPDALASYEVDGVTYFVSANEGDGRDVDESRGADLVDGDPANGEIDVNDLPADLQAQLADEALLGRLKFSNVDGDVDGDGLIEELFAFGSRSFTIFDEFGNVVFDSGEDFEVITAALTPEEFNSNGLAGSFDSRSDDKGPEPEAVAIGEVDGRIYAFVGLERVGGIMVYDITDPLNATFDSYFRNEDADGNLLDIAPEGLRFIPADESPNGGALLAVASEESNTLTLHALSPANPTVLISEVQGETDFRRFVGDAAPTVAIDDISPLAGETVTIEAIVTADMQFGAAGTPGSDLGGFFVQEEEADQDDNPFTSEGLFVFEGGDTFLTDVEVGDLVRVTGTVTEFFGMTQISATFIDVVSSGNALPAATVVEFPTTGLMFDDDGNLVADLEAVEGMLVTVPTGMSVTEMFNLDRFGEYRLSSDGRLQQYTQNNDPSVEGFAQHLRDIAKRSIVVDDGRTDQNPETLEIIDGNNGVLDAGDSFRMGDTITNLTGVVNYAFDEFRLQDATGDYSRENPRPETPDALDGNFTVASLNVLNFFTTIDDGATATDTGLEPRGADDLTRFAPGNSDLANTDPDAEFDRQQSKLVNAIVAIDADIIGLVEIENTADDRALSVLVDAVNAVAGEGTYAFIDAATRNGGPIGGDAITQAIIYKPAEVTPVGDVAVLDSTDDVPSGRDFIDPLNAGRPLNRPALAQTFEDNGTGQLVTVSVNHLKSKGSLSGLPEDEAQGDGQGNNNATRAEAADILAEWLATDPTGTGAEKQLIVGDLNSYAREDPIRVLEDAGFTDIAGEVLGEAALSFVFDGQTGTLDYAMANAALLEDLAGVTEWHINADEADAIDYNLDFGRSSDLFDGDSPARSSDHDPVIVSFDLDPVAIEIVGTDRRDRLVGTDADEILNGLDGRDTYRGGGGADIFVIGAEDGDRVIDFQPGIDRLDLSEWGVQVIEELRIADNGFGVFIRDLGNMRNIVRIASEDPEFAAADLTGESIVFAPIEDRILTGSDRREKLVGGGGRDILDGLARSDTYFGNAGADIFVAGTDAPDRIRDFEDGLDLIDISGWGAGFEDLRFRGGETFTRVSDGTHSVLVRGSDGAGVDPLDLTEDDFLFGPNLG